MKKKFEELRDMVLDYEPAGADVYGDKWDGLRVEVDNRLRALEGIALGYYQDGMALRRMRREDVEKAESEKEKIFQMLMSVEMVDAAIHVEWMRLFDADPKDFDRLSDGEKEQWRQKWRSVFRALIEELRKRA